MKEVLMHLKNKKGASAIGSLIILFFCVLLFAFVFWIYSIYTISMNIHNTFERAIRTVATFNETEVFENLRENVFDITEEDFANLITLDELNEEVIRELGVDERGSELVKTTSGGGYDYRIYDIDVDYAYDSTGNILTFVATGKIDIPLSSIGGNINKITLDLNVKSRYLSKLGGEAYTAAPIN